jgi:hypothetical protein
LQDNQSTLTIIQIRFNTFAFKNNTKDLPTTRLNPRKQQKHTKLEQGMVILSWFALPWSVFSSPQGRACQKEVQAKQTILAKAEHHHKP